MTLSIITINRNNAHGLKKTMQSVVSQTSKDLEYIVVDGASTDESVEVIKHFAEQRDIRWVSKRDKGIYNAMNKGIGMAQGEYVMILNSGDYLASPQVVDEMDKGSLFAQYGPFDESLKICSDWAWMLKTVGMNGVKPLHVDLDTLYFDMTGVSEGGERSRQTIRNERQQVLNQTLPAAVLEDYDRYATDILMMRRLRRHPWAFRWVRLIERILFKIEKRRPNS